MRSEGRVRPAVPGLAIGGAVTAGVLLGTVLRTMPAPTHHWPVLAVAAMFALAQLTVIRVDADLILVLLDVPLVIGLIGLPPPLFVAAWVVSGLVTLGLVRRQPVLQLGYNLSAFALQSVVAVLVFRAISDGHNLLAARTLAGLLVASAVVSILGTLLVRAAESRQWHMGDLAAVIPGLGTSLSVSGLVLVGVVVEQADPTLLWVLALPVAGVAWAGRRLTTLLGTRGDGGGEAPTVHADVATGLPDQEEFAYELARAQAAGERIACLLINLDGAHGTGEGAEEGEALTVVAAQRVAGCLRAGDLATRLGPHSRVVLAHVDPAAARAEAEAVHDRLRSALERPAKIGDTNLPMKARLGVVVPAPGDSPADVLAAASLAMTDRRRSGRSRPRPAAAQPEQAFV